MYGGTKITGYRIHYDTGTSGEDRSLDERELTPSELSTSRSVTPIGESTADSKGKKRKRSTEKADRMEGFLDKVIKMQAESENKFLNLEEKMMEMEVQRQESREFHAAANDVLVVLPPRCNYTSNAWNQC